MPFTLNLPGLFALATLFTVVAIAYWEFGPAFRERRQVRQILETLAPPAAQVPPFVSTRLSNVLFTPSTLLILVAGVPIIVGTRVFGQLFQAWQIAGATIGAVWLGLLVIAPGWKTRLHATGFSIGLFGIFGGEDLAKHFHFHYLNSSWIFTLSVMLNTAFSPTAKKV